MINELNETFLKLFFDGKNKSIDKFMIPYYRTHDSRQRINS